jgi:hypothetical protein
MEGLQPYFDCVDIESPTATAHGTRVFMGRHNDDGQRAEVFVSHVKLEAGFERAPLGEPAAEGAIYAWVRVRVRDVKIGGRK